MLTIEERNVVLDNNLTDEGINWEGVFADLYYNFAFDKLTAEMLTQQLREDRPRVV